MVASSSHPMASWGSTRPSSPTLSRPRARPFGANSTTTDGTAGPWTKSLRTVFAPLDRFRADGSYILRSRPLGLVRWPSADDRAVRLPPFPHGPYGKGCLAGGFALRRRAVPGGMGCDDQPRMGWRAMFPGRWLNRENVQRRTG